MSESLVSVIIPTYNRKQLLKKAVDSVLKQTYGNFELLVVDDHSDQNIENAVESYKDSRVKFLKNSRTKGAQGARNTGIDKSKGSWVAFLDSDDIWHPEKLEIQINYLKKANKNLVCVSTHYTTKDIFDIKLETSSFKSKSYHKQELYYGNTFGGFSSILCKKKTLKQIGGLDENFSSMQDLDLFIQLSEVGKIVKLNLNLVQHNFEHSTRITKNYKAKYDSAILFYDKYHSDIAKDPKLLNKSRLRILKFALKTGDFSFFREKITWLVAGFLKNPKDVYFIFKILLLNLNKYFFSNNSSRNPS